MRDLFGARRGETIVFVVFAALFTVGVFGWTLFIADDVFGSLPFMSGLGLPDQSVSKAVIALLLYLLAMLYALASIAAGPHRRALGGMLIYGLLSFLAWSALNYWVIAGFLNAPILYGVVAVVLMGAWLLATMFFVARLHDPLADFLVKFGMGVALFITIVQIVALLTPEWRSPTQGIPVLYNLTLNGLVGMFMAGIGGNMLWRERRAQALASAGRRR